MAILLVQKGGVEATGPGTPATINWSPSGSSTAGNLIAVLIASYSQATGTYTVTDQAGTNAFTQATDFPWDINWSAKSALWYLPNCPAGITGVRVACAATAFQSTIAIAEFSGCLTASPIGQTATATGNSTAASSGNVTPADAGSLIWGGGVNAGVVSGTFALNTVGAGFTADYNSSAGDVGMTSIAEHQIPAGTAALAATFGLSATDQWWAHAAVFKPAAGGGPAFVARRPYALRQAVKRAAYY